MNTPDLRPPGASSDKDSGLTPPDAAPAAAETRTDPANRTKEPVSHRHVPVLDQQQIKKTAGNSAGTTPEQSTIPPLYWFGAGLIVIALVVIFVLPAMVDNRPPPVTSSSAPPASLPSIASTANRQPNQQPNQQQRLAKQLLADVLALRATLEAENVQQWAAREYQNILQAADKAASHFAKSHYLESVTGYQRVIEDLKNLRNSKPARLAAALQAGQQSLEEQNSSAAQQHFNTALAIEPQNAQAREGLQRAQNLDQVLALMEQAQSLIDQAEPEKAREILQQVTALDPAYQAAADLLAKLESQISQSVFAQTLAETEEALLKGKLSQARQHLASLRKLDPTASELTDIAQRIRLRAKQLRLNALRKEAQGAAAREDWQQALEKYRQALKSDPKLSFALRGKQQAEQEIHLNKDIEHYLKQPDRLAENQVLRNAQTLLGQLQAIPSPGPQRIAQTQKLAQLISDAQTLIPVTITSDGETRITIKRVSRLGTLTRKDLDLRPGTYTIVGARDGYRDVRQTIKISARQESLALDVRCKEAI